MAISNGDGRSNKIDRYLKIESTSEERKSSKNSLFANFVDRLKNTFDQWGDQESKLANRSQKIIPKVEILLNQLTSIETTDSEDRPLFISLIIKPLIREGSTIRSQITLNNHPVRHQTASHYILWVDRSYKWIDRYYQLNEDELHQEVVKYIIEETRFVIQKDITLISDYKQQQLTSLDLTEQQLIDLEEVINSGLNVFIEELHVLEKAFPRQNSPEGVQQWRFSTDEARQKLFDNSLEVIDQLVKQGLPLPKTRQNREHMVQALAHIISFERDVEEVTHTLKQGLSEDRLQLLKNKTIALYQQGHDITLDVQLPKELFNRVKGVMKDLTRFHTNL